MLTGLSIRDVVLIERLDLVFRSGLCVLTGETGAGKSILLDALGLALGGRSEAALIRKGADQAVVTATFEPPKDHPVYQLLTDQGLDAGNGSEPLLVRRIVNRDGRSRAFINDQPSSVSLLRQAGDLMVEVHGQHDQRGLLDPATHRGLLDAFAGLGAEVTATRTAWDAWKAAEAERDKAADASAAARADETYLRDALDQLERLDPQADE
ncbi:MAG: AAA family ATPase, partial [Bauldia litoralis]